MNIATILGIVVGIVILALATFFSTPDVWVFVNLAGMAIVIGGTAAATFICYPLKEVTRVLHVFLLALAREDLPTDTYINALVDIARTASAKGKVSLEKSLPGIENNFLRQGVQMLVDGYSSAEIREIMDTSIQQMYETETSSAGIFRTMAKLAPAFGIIGTLIGLISMMQSMGTDIRGLGPAMAVALTTTLYGVTIANLLCLPIAIKVERRIEERVVLMQVIRDGILFIKDKTPAQIVLDKLRAYLPPRRWASVKA